MSVPSMPSGGVVTHDGAGDAMSCAALPRAMENSSKNIALAVADGVDRLIGRLLEVCVSILLAAEILLLFAGVLARYVFLKPIIWSDELASMLFLWLVMLGSAIALRRGEHMRMTALFAFVSPRMRAQLDTIALAASLGLVVLLFPAALEYAIEEAIVRTPAMDLSNAWRATAAPVGFGLMGIFALLRLVRLADTRLIFSSLGTVAFIVGLFWLLQPLFAPLGNINLVIFFVVVVASAVFTGVPIAFSFGLATFGYLMLTTRTPPLIIVGRIDEGVSHLILLSVPLFVFLGQLIEMTGMARAMVAFLASLLGHVRGGLLYVLVGAMYLVSGISGSKAADMAAVAPVLFPEMKRRGAKEGDLVALLAATGAQTETIPPSIVLITIGSVTGVSIAALFTGGLLPGVILAITLCCVIAWRYRNEDRSLARRASAKEIGKTFLVAVPAIALPFVIRSAVIEGVATATEVSTIGIFYAIVVGAVFYRQFDWRRITPMLVETASLSGAILFIIGTATSMAWSLTQSGFSRSLAVAMKQLPGGSMSFMAVSIVAFVVLGSVLEGIPAIVLFGPLLFPIAQALGIDLVHYSMVVILAMGVGLFAPPFGVGYYAACAISRVSPDAGMRPIVGYMTALLIGLAIVALVPWISTGFL
ncbi:tripartite ATP-independent transporter DctM subunit [Bradyrhizobium elkanii]|uniref:Tripartite ATP-independent transporter DctM subunit n=4 Tax=Nitrobacteraceae TaxID=41294 RepID=A0ABV4EQ74_BRAEL|nr:tripartite ATP-independent transporter DctM subunit [Bradyrhizobium elkanii]MCP1984943.1 tripartite ATP-independent transporter DctM subunit [Bradyrhizobium elkanii]MCS3695298.1 tripartite ATP-independent transporter DctM subunit [Bradyrhizobium elkanii]MCS3890703.1 tripartite ATP-independent transporter DctM subunit [Bradyrhizobium elkanii]MCS4220603.1 tripartite ATP-independent transporter DctM subunit [Bradyrhizobium elkanii]